MIGPNFMEEIDCGSFFDHIDDLLDFPSEADIEAGLTTGESNSFPSIWEGEPESLPRSESVFSAKTTSDLSAELSVPYEDIVQLEWLSNFVEDSSGVSLTMKKEEDSRAPRHNHFRTSSPVSVLDSSSSSCSADKVAGAAPRSPEAIPALAAEKKNARARSKRRRPATFGPRSAAGLMPRPSSSSEEENVAESRLVIKIPRQALGGEHAGEKKNSSSCSSKKKVRIVGPTTDEEEKENEGVAPVRKCMHCEVTKTPQWRAGPMGPKTLCNACGVRYKSGRLFPEYRPAASPTFVPALHSNSHKKVLEMRSKMGEEGDLVVNETAELIPNGSHNIAMEYM